LADLRERTGNRLGRRLADLCLFRDKTADSLTQLNYNLANIRVYVRVSQRNAEMLTRRRRNWIGDHKNFHRRIYPFDLLRR